MNQLKFARAFLVVVLLLPSLSEAADELMTVDYRALVSRADLDYTNPATRSEEGMPVGDGRMGSLVWTTPTALHFQINRCDVFAENSYTASFPVPNTDYAAGCGYVDLNLATVGDDVFAGKNFHQHLSLYDALMTAQGNGVAVRVVAPLQRDVIAVEIDDQRKNPEPITVDLRMLRYRIQPVAGRNYELATNHAVLFQQAEQSALSKLDIRDGRVLLIQQFREKSFYDSSAIAISVAGRKTKAVYLNESTVQLAAAAGKGKFTILISSAATFDPERDVGAMAVDQLRPAEAKTFAALQSETADGWHDFWRRGFVSLHSDSGQADFVEANYTYYLYLMGASSRGDYPPRFGGMLWRTTGDMSLWGSQYWWANTSAYYNNLMPANRLELMDPMFLLYWGMRDACATAARQQWGSQGIWIPETEFFNGPEKLPDDIAAELQDLVLVRKPYSERSTNFQWFAEVKVMEEGRWDFLAKGHWDHGHWVVPTNGGRRRGDDGGTPAEIFGYTTHILGVGSRVANLFWQRYQYTMDTNWLSDRAYPLIKDAAEFYRNFPNFTKDADGTYHLHHVNNGESQWNSSDAPYEVVCLHMIFPIAIRASEILGVDADLRAQWREINEHLMPLPAHRYPGGGDWSVFGTNAPPLELNTNAAASSAGRRDDAYGAFVATGPGGIDPIGPQPELKRRFLGFDRLGSFIDARSGGGAQIFRNRLRLREGPGAIDAEHLGGLASGIHSTMLSSAPETPEGDPVLSIFNRWPDDWDAAFELLARGAFLVSSTHVNGTIPFVKIQSQAGGECVLKNPWSNETVTLYRNGKKSENLSGDLLKFETAKNENIVVLRAGTAPENFKVPVAIKK